MEKYLLNTSLHNLHIEDDTNDNVFLNEHIPGKNQVVQPQVQFFTISYFFPIWHL